MIQRRGERLCVPTDVHQPCLQRRHRREAGADQQDERDALHAQWTATEKSAKTAAFQAMAPTIVGSRPRSAKRGPTTLPRIMPAPKQASTAGTHASGMPETWTSVGVM